MRRTIEISALLKSDGWHARVVFGEHDLLSGEAFLTVEEVKKYSDNVLVPLVMESFKDQLDKITILFNKECDA